MGERLGAEIVPGVYRECEPDTKDARRFTTERVTLQGKPATSSAEWGGNEMSVIICGHHRIHVDIVEIDKEF